jgi:hypothetical protein
MTKYTKKAIESAKWLNNIPNGHNISYPRPFKKYPGVQINHLATLR